MKKLINSRQNHHVIEVVFYSACLRTRDLMDRQEGQPAASEVLDTPDSGALLPSSMAAEAREQAQPWPGFSLSLANAHPACHYIVKEIVSRRSGHTTAVDRHAGPDP